MNAKRWIACAVMVVVVLICVVVIVLMTSCGPKEPAAAPYTLDDAQTLLDTGLFSADMGKIDDTYIISMLYHVDENAIRECVSYQATNTGESADEITVIVFSDEAAAASGEAGFRQRVEDQIESLENYAPAAIPHLEAAVIRRAGSTVLLAVGDPGGVAEAVDNLH